MSALEILAGDLEHFQVAVSMMDKRNVRYYVVNRHIGQHLVAVSMMDKRNVRSNYPLPADISRPVAVSMMDKRNVRDTSLADLSSTAKSRYR